jgi:hypothetical protein
MIERSSKHRYVFFLNAADKKLLQWEILPYPKRSNRGTSGEKAHLKSVCRFEFLPYTKHRAAPEVTAAGSAPVVRVDDAGVLLASSSCPQENVYSCDGHTGLIGKLPLSGANGLPCEMEEL